MSWQSLSKQAQWAQNNSLLFWWWGMCAVNWNIVGSKRNKAKQSLVSCVTALSIKRPKLRVIAGCVRRGLPLSLLTDSNHVAEFLLTKLNMSLHRTCDILFSSHWHVFTWVQISCNILFKFYLENSWVFSVFHAVWWFVWNQIHLRRILDCCNTGYGAFGAWWKS